MSSGRVLLVDDDAHIRRTLTTALSRAGFEVTSLENGEAVLALPSIEGFDAVLVDYHMSSDLTGVDVVRAVKQRHGASIYCALLSGEDDDALRERCAEAGADDVFQKPASPRVLRERLAAAIAQLHRAA